MFRSARGWYDIVNSSPPYFQREPGKIWFPSGWALYTLMAFFIGLVSVYDGYLVYVFRDLIVDMEKNPLGVHLINLNGGDVSLFLTTKAIGTSLCLLILIGLYLRMQKLAFPIASGVAVFQLGLLGYLTF